MKKVNLQYLSNMENINRMAVHFWLAVSIASLIYAVVMVYKHGWDEGAPNFFVPVVAFVWYLFRRMMLKRMNRPQE